MTITSYARLMLLSQRQVTCQALSPSGARFPAGEAEAENWLYWLGTVQTKGKKPENLEEGARRRGGDLPYQDLTFPVTAASSAGRCNTIQSVDPTLLPLENGRTRSKPSKGNVSADLI